jgi:ribosomal silencing factor RsfS
VETEETMKIPWRQDLEKAFEEGRRSGRWVLLDFSAAPM